MSKCIGCGVTLQNVDSTKPGYIPQEIIETEQNEFYCQRCFQIRNYHKKYETQKLSVENQKALFDIRNQKALVVLMIDVLDPFGGFFPDLSKAVGDNPVLILMNKQDVLPKSLKTDFLEKLVRTLAKENHLNVEAVLFVSALKKKGIEKVVQKIAKIKYKFVKGKKQECFKNAYVVGTTSVGKSTFMNTLSSMYLNNTTNPITTSDQYQTTLGFIKLPLDQNSFFIDTPGVISPTCYGTYLNYDSMKNLTPSHFIREKVFFLHPGQTLLLGGLAEVDFLEQDISCTVYASNDLFLHRLKTENASEFRTRHQCELLKPPYTEEELEKITPWVDHEYELTEDMMNVYISGLGLLHFKGKSGKIRVSCFEKISVKSVQEASHDQD
jgi:ribosome biogenesis GTPase YqeH